MINKVVQEKIKTYLSLDLGRVEDEVVDTPRSRVNPPILIDINIYRLNS